MREVSREMRAKTFAFLHRSVRICGNILTKYVVKLCKKCVNKRPCNII